MANMIKIGKSKNGKKIKWYARLGSNQRLSAPEADALSTELRAHMQFLIDEGFL